MEGKWQTQDATMVHSGIKVCDVTPSLTMTDQFRYCAFSSITRSISDGMDEQAEKPS